MSAVHLHASHGPCSTECGLPWDSVDTAYRGVDPQRVTCPECRKRQS